MRNEIKNAHLNKNRKKRENGGGNGTGFLAYHSLGFD